MATRKKPTKTKAAPAFSLKIPKEIKEKEFLQRILEDAAKGVAIGAVVGRINNINSAMKYSINGDEFNPQSFDDEMVAVAIVELLKNKSTPQSLTDALCDHLEAVARSTGQWGWAKATDTEDIEKWLAFALEAMRDDPSLAPKSEAPITIEGMDVDVLVKAIQVLQRILPNSQAHQMDCLLDEAAFGIAESDTSCNPDILRLWLPKLAERKGDEQ